MERPKSFTFLFFFTIWSVLQGLESLIGPAGSRLQFEEYNLSILYYIFIAIAVLGGIALVFAIYKRKVWGYQTGLIWLISGIVYSGYVGIISIINKPLMEAILIAQREQKGRPVEDVSDFINSTGFDATIIITTLVMIVIMGFFIWKLLQNKSYFSEKF